MIVVLCYSCETHLFNTNIQILDWPLTSEMFQVVYPGYFMRPGYINLDNFCPCCGQFPFSYDPYTHGGSAVGKSLKIKNPDGKPVVKTIKQILLDSRESALPKVSVAVAPSPSKTGALIEPPGICIDCKGVLTETHVCKKPEFPCPTCGAKKRFHKKGCALKEIPIPNAHPKDIKEIPIPNAIPSETDTISLDKHARLSELKDRDRAHNPLVASIAGRVQGMSADKGDGPPTDAEVREVLADRESRRMEIDKAVDVRPGEGYQPQRI